LPAYLQIEAVVKIVIAAIIALFALGVLILLVGLWLYVWGMREPLQFHEIFDRLQSLDWEV